MNEYGGYMDMERYNGPEFHNDCIKLNSARSALKYIIKARNIQTIYLPLLLCDSIYDTCIEENVNVIFYNINEDFKPVLPEKIEKSAYIYIINYYGRISKQYINKIKRKYKNIILDNVQAFFDKHIEDIDTIYSCRKYFGVPDGAYLYTNKIIKESLNTSYSSDKMLYILKRYEETAEKNYNLFLQNEEMIGKEDIEYMSRVTNNILKSIDYFGVKRIREKNYKYLNSKLSKYNIIKLKSKPNGPYMYPFCIKNGAEIRKKLQKDHLYIPKLWPYFEKNSNIDESQEIIMADNILPIPCDQRYNISDMKKIISIITEYMIK